MQVAGFGGLSLPIKVPHKGGTSTRDSPSDPAAVSRVLRCSSGRDWGCRLTVRSSVAVLAEQASNRSGDAERRMRVRKRRCAELPRFACTPEQHHIGKGVSRQNAGELTIGTSNQDRGR